LREEHPGKCDSCGQAFRWYLIHNGFNSSCHAYCSRCGATAILSLHSPRLANLNAFPGGITPTLESLLRPCKCEGSFLATAIPRCPSCLNELSAIEASKYIEPPMPGTPQGWRWQGLWTGDRALYAIIINDRLLEDSFIDQP
jgi:ribosomal protein S27AE